MHPIKGSVIALYGINNLGKTTQRDLLLEKLGKKGMRAFGYKYARYDIEPSGSMLNAYLREGNPLRLSAREFQTIQVINRMQVEPTLIAQKKAKGIVVVEDYTGTGIAWGIGAGVEKAYLLKLNAHLLKEDLAILLTGERFLSGVEKSHAHESKDELTDKVRAIHLELAKEFGWHIVDANQSKEDVHDDIWKIVEAYISNTSLWTS